MKLLFKQRMFSWLDSYDVYNEAGETVFKVEGQFSFGHCLHILDSRNRHIGTVKEVVFTFLPCFELYVEENYLGRITKEFTFLTPPKYNFDFNGWHIEGHFMEWDYEIYDAEGDIAATVSKELFNWTDTYSINVVRNEDALLALMFVLAIDAEKCSRDN